MSVRPDPRQFDLFASPAPVTAAAVSQVALAFADRMAELAAEEEIAEAEASADPLDIDEDENEAGEVVDVAIKRRNSWEQERAAIEAALAANKPEVLRWGKGARSMTDAYWEVSLLRDGDLWRVKTDFSMPNSGGGGPFSCPKWKTRDEALIATLRVKLRQIASHLAVYGDGEWGVSYGKPAQWRSLASWCVEQAPSALFGGPDLAAEFTAMEVEEQAREQRRRTALKAAHDLQERGRQIVLAAGVYGYPDLIQNPDVTEWGGAGADPVGHAAKWPATWAVTGHAPDRLAIRVFPRHGHSTDEVVTRTVDALRAGLDVPVEVAEIEEGGAPYYRAAKWTWDE